MELSTDDVKHMVSLRRFEKDRVFSCVFLKKSETIWVKLSPSEMKEKLQQGCRTNGTTTNADGVIWTNII